MRERLAGGVEYHHAVEVSDLPLSWNTLRRDVGRLGLQRAVGSQRTTDCLAVDAEASARLDPRASISLVLPPSVRRR